MSWTNLENKVVVVTGGAAGIGLAVVKGLVEVGAQVMIADFSEEAGFRRWRKRIPMVPDKLIFTSVTNFQKGCGCPYRGDRAKVGNGGRSGE